MANETPLNNENNQNPNEPQNLDGIIIEPGSDGAQTSQTPPQAPTPTATPPAQPEKPQDLPDVMEQPIHGTPAPEKKEEVVENGVDIKIEGKKKDEGEQKPKLDAKAKNALRTYEKDVAEVMRRKKASVASIKVAQQLKEDKEKEEAKKKEDSVSEKPKRKLPKLNIKININWNQVFYTLLIIFILLAIAAGVTLYLDSRGGGTTEVVSDDEFRPEQFFLVEKEIEIPVDRSGTREITNTINDKKDEGVVGEMVQLYYTVGTIDGSRRGVGFQEFAELLNLNMPYLLLRNIDSTFMFGLHVFDGTNPFMVLKTPSRQSAFAGMLQWERDMRRDLDDIFENRSSEALRVGTTTQSVLNTRGSFKDELIQNRDTRVLVDSVGDTVLLYSFITDDTIVITTDTDTLVEIIKRIERVQFTR